MSEDFSKGKRGPVVKPDPNKTRMAIRLDADIIERFSLVALVGLLSSVAQAQPTDCVLHDPVQSGWIRERNISIEYAARSERSACLYISEVFHKEGRPKSDFPDCNSGRFIDHPLNKIVTEGDKINFFEAPRECWEIAGIISGYVIERDGRQVGMLPYMTYEKPHNVDQ